MSHHFTAFTRKTFGIIFVAALLALALTLTTHARDVPFTTGHIIGGNITGEYSVATADVDGDGDLDVLGAAPNADDITWWENVDRAGPGTGDGSAWREQIVDGVFYGAISVAAADVDGDGDLDILGAAQDADDIAWWENTAGDGSAWSEHTVDGSFNGARDVATADVDGDGDLDVLGAGYDATEIAWWENTAGDGSAWSKHSVVSNPSLWPKNVAAADVDGDGDLDVLGAYEKDFEDDAIAWWENTAGDGSAWSKHSVTTDYWLDAYGVVAADMDGDGDLDILGTSGEGIAWWGNTAGDGSTWTKHSLNDFGTMGGVAAADMDGDGDLDVLGASQDFDDIAWWENRLEDGFAWSEHWMAGSFDGAWDVAAADVDGDGDLDVLGAAMGAGDIAWWENETIHRSAVYPAAGKTVVWANFVEVRSVAAANVDGDGDLDILAASFYESEIVWWENTAGDGSDWRTYRVATGFEGAASVAATDMDGDGDLDVLGAAFNADEIAWWENTAGDGSTWSEHTVDGSFDGAYDVAAADVDGDGDLDALGAGGREIGWWENTAGDGSAWSEHSVDGSFNGASDVAAADMDGDGDLDVLGAAWLANDITWWENTAGDGSAWSEHNVDADFVGAHSVAAVDVDGDGDLDILGAANGDDEIAWWENSAGDGSTWSKHTVAGSFDAAWDVAAADLDGDGDLDILGAGWQADEIAWWENTAGDGSAWSEHTVASSFDGAASVAPADLDGDGDLDILGAAEAANDIAWWKNRGGQFALATTDTAPTQLAGGQTDDLLKITMTHRGRSDDGAEELATLELLFEDGHGDPLTSAEANAVVGKLTIYLDDGSGAFEIGSDTLVTTVETLSLTEGVQTVGFADGDANVLVQFGTPRSYFVVVEIAADASTQTAIDQFQVTHVTASSSTAQDRDHDIPLILEYAADVASSNVIVPITRIWDGGGTTQNWSEAANWVSDIVPRDALDGARFDSTSSENAVVDADFDRTPASVVIASGYTGQITQDTDLTVSGDWSQDGGTYTGGSSRLDLGGAFDLNGETFTAPLGLMSVGGGFHHSGGTFDPNGGRVVLDNTSDQTLATTFNDLVLNDGLLGYWKLDEGSGTTAADSSGYGHDGTLHNSPVWSTDTPSTMDFYDLYALGFNRTDSVEYVEMSGTTQIDQAQELTLSTWVRLDSTPTGAGYTYMRFITLGHEKAVLRYVDDGGTNQLQFYMNIGGSLRSIRVDHPWVTGAWYHVAGTYDGSTMRLYLDGVELGTYSISDEVTAGDGVRLSHSANSAALDGMMDDVRVYNRELSADEINDLAGGKHPQTSIAITSLGAALDVNGDLILNSGTLAQPQTAGYWKLDEGAGTTTADSSGNGHDGVLHNSPIWSTDTPGTHFSNPYALQFNRSDADYVSITNATDVDDLQQLTLATWVKLDTMPAGQTMRFVTLRNEKAVVRYDGANGPGQLHFYVKIDGGFHSIRVNDVLSAGVWLHVAGTYDGSTMRLYLNGTEQPGARSVSGAVATGDGIYLSWSGSDGALDGLLDDVRVYNQALSGTEVQALADGYDVRTHDITVAGDFVRNGGVFEAGGGMVTFDGTGTQTLDTDVITFHDLTVEEGVTLDLGSATALQVDGALANNGGLKQSKEVDGSNTTFLHIKDGSGTQDRYFGLEIDPGTGDMGSTSVTVWGNQLCPNARAGVLRCFELAPTTPQTATVRFYYTEAERNGEDNATMDVYHRNETHKRWEQEGGSYERGGSGDGQYVQVTDVDGYSPFALSDSRLHEWIEHWLYLPVVSKR